MFIEIKTTKDLTTSLAQQIVNVASKQDTTTYILYGNKKVNSKSIMGVISLGLKKGDVVFLEATGDNANDAIEEIKELL